MCWLSYISKIIAVMGWQQEIVCPGYISETVRCRKFILGRDIGWGCRCATSWSDLDLTFDLAVVTLSLKKEAKNKQVFRSANIY